jgi:putative heme transporter
VNATVEVFQDEVEDDAPRTHPRVRARRLLRLLLSCAVAALLIGYALPHLLGTTTSSMLAALGQVSVGEIGLVAGIWAMGLLTHSFVLTGAMPGLTRVRALMLNLTGSAVANVLPFGGAAATTVNYRMARSWNVSLPSFAAFTLIANVWWIIVKLTLPLFAVVVLSLSGDLRSGGLQAVAVGSTVGLAAISAALTLLVRGSGAGAFHRISNMVSGVAARLGRAWAPETLAVGLAEARGQTAAIVASRWPQLCGGMLGYAAFQALLLGVCLHAVGGHPSWPVVFGAYAIDRVLTLAVFMPGAAGVSELGVAAALVALGGAPGATAAGVVLYRGFTFGIEIPIGGGWLAGWAGVRWWRRRRGAEPRPVSAAEARG